MKDIKNSDQPTGTVTRMDGESSLARLVAYWMDNCFTIPGTKLRVGWNPLLDLVPGVGDIVAVVISALTLVVAAQARVPAVVLVRMSLNILLNAVVGLVPVVGELFAFWFRPSQRNYELLQKHVSSDGQLRGASTWGDWVVVISLIGAVVTGLILLILAGAYVMIRLFHWMYGQ
jgi:hypothetical protein